jgi:hypothetical protein
LSALQPSTPTVRVIRNIYIYTYIYILLLVALIFKSPLSLIIFL